MYYYTFLFLISQILTYLITQLILKLNSLRNGILKTALSLPSSKILKEIITFLPLISISTSPVSIYIILSLYSIGSPKMVTNRYRFSLSLYSNPILLTTDSDIWFFVILLFTNTLNFLFCYLACRFRCFLMIPLRV